MFKKDRSQTEVSTYNRKAGIDVKEGDAVYLIVRESSTYGLSCMHIKS